MRKALATLACSAALICGAGAQDMATDQPQENHGKARAQTHSQGGQVREHANIQGQSNVPRQSQQLRNEFRGRDRADVNVQGRADVNASATAQPRERNERERHDVNINRGDRNRTDIDVTNRNRTDVDVTNRNRTDVNLGESGRQFRAEHRDGRFYFRDRVINRYTNIDRNDWHFRIGFHDRTWYLTRYEVVLVDGCWYYVDGPYLYPAYGFDPDCQYPDQYIVFQIG